MFLEACKTRGTIIIVRTIHSLSARVEKMEKKSLHKLFEKEHVFFAYLMHHLKKENFSKKVA